MKIYEVWKYISLFCITVCLETFFARNTLMRCGEQKAFWKELLNLLRRDKFATGISFSGNRNYVWCSLNLLNYWQWRIYKKMHRQKMKQFKKIKFTYVIVWNDRQLQNWNILLINRCSTVYEFLWIQIILIYNMTNNNYVIISFLTSIWIFVPKS